MNVKMHIWSWEPFRRDAACVCMLVCVCREGQSSSAGGGVHSIFHSWHISLGGARRCDKRVVHLGACDARCVIVSPVA